MTFDLSVIEGASTSWRSRHDPDDTSWPSAISQTSPNDSLIELPTTAYTCRAEGAVQLASSDPLAIRQDGATHYAVTNGPDVT